MSEQQEAVAVIPARGGSKGLPRKNVSDLAGRPLIAHTIAAALGAETIGRVLVSTDDAEIMAVAERFGADVIERPADLSGDEASSESALLHAISVLELGGGVPDVVVMLQCTSPLTRAEDIDATVRAMRDASADSAFSASDFHHFLWELDDSGAARPIAHDAAKRLRRQDRVPPLLETGAVYAMRVKPFREAKTRFCGRTVAARVDASRTLEIDDERDLVLARALAERGQREARRALLPAPPDAVIFDFDGVFTDNAVLVRQDEIESVRCSRGDGMGIGLLKKAGVPILVMSKERNPVVGARMNKLKLEFMQAVDDKLPLLREWLAKRDLDIEKCIYVGNDVNDLPCLRAVGCGVCPSDAHAAAKSASRVILEAAGGHGAVRELCDLVLEGLGADGR